MILPCFRELKQPAAVLMGELLIFHPEFAEKKIKIEERTEIHST